jgi:hypothetical protein
MLSINPCPKPTQQTGLDYPGIIESDRPLIVDLHHVASKATKPSKTIKYRYILEISAKMTTNSAKPQKTHAPASA